MKRFLPCVIAITMSALVTAQSDGQDKVTKKLPVKPSDATVPKSMDAKIRTTPSKEIKGAVAGGIGLIEVVAKRDPKTGKVIMTGVISNSSYQRLGGVTYSFSRKTAQGWTQIKSIRLESLGEKARWPVLVELEPSKEEITLRLEVKGPGAFGAPAVHRIEDRTIAKQKLFVVWYTTGATWVFVGNQDSDKAVATLRSLGFEARPTRLNPAGWEVRTTGPIGQKRSFTSRAAANEFRTQLRSLTRSDVGLHMRLSEE